MTKQYFELRDGSLNFGGTVIPPNDQNRHYRQALTEAAIGEAEIIPYVEPPANPVQVRDEALASLFHDFGDGRVVWCRPHPFPDESNMRNAIEQMNRLSQSERLWLGTDDVAVTVTAADLQTVIESGQDQSSAVWSDFLTAIGV